MNWLALGVALSVAVACYGAGGQTPEDETVTVPPGAEGLVEEARADLRERTGAESSAIALRSVESVDWPDSSLGCPEPDRLYAQVITPGYRIVVVVDSEEHEYHASTSRVVYCPAERRPGSGLDGTPA